MSDATKKARDKLRAELLKLAKKYTSIFPTYTKQAHCPAKGCGITWINLPKGAEYCHIHGRKLEQGEAQLTYYEVLDEISFLANYVRDEELKEQSND